MTNPESRDAVPDAPSLLSDAWNLADDLDSNHARWVVQEVARRHGIEVEFRDPALNEPNNRLREQLAEARQDSLDEVERLRSAAQAVTSAWVGFYDDASDEAAFDALGKAVHDLRVLTTTEAKPKP
jgi:uncharacterized protein YecT (DUF1311 family)